MADLMDYVFQFPDRASALADSVVGPFFTSPPAGVPLEVLVYKDTRKDSVSPATGFWFLVETVGPNAALAAHPNLQILNNATAMRNGQPSATASFDVSHTNIIFSSFGTYCANGLVKV